MDIDDVRINWYRQRAEEEASEAQLWRESGLRAYRQAFKLLGEDNLRIGQQHLREAAHYANLVIDLELEKK